MALINNPYSTKYQKGEHLLFSPVSMGGNSISIYLVRIQLWVLQHYVQYLINQDLSMRDFFLMSVNIDRKGSMRTKWSFEGNPLFFKIISKGLLLCCAVLCLVPRPYPTLCDPKEPARLLLPWGFSRQECWTGLPYSPGDLPNPGIEARSLTLWEDCLPSEPPGKPKNTGVGNLSLL